MNLDLLLVVAVILLGIRLPSYMNRIGMPKADKLTFVLLAFLVLGIAWFSWHVIGTYI
jgi:uncharacterized membrane protein